MNESSKVERGSPSRKDKRSGTVSTFHKKKGGKKNLERKQEPVWPKKELTRPHSGKTIVKLPSALELPNSQVNSPFSKFELSPPPKVPLVNKSPLFKESYTGTGLGYKAPSLERLRKQIREEEA